MEVRGLHAWTFEIMKIECSNINKYFVLIEHQTWVTTVLKWNEMNANPGVLQKNKNEQCQ